MKIKLSTLYAGPSGVMEPGSVHDVDPALARALVEGGYAKLVPTPAPAAAPDPAPVVEEPPIETAVPESNLTAEKAIGPRPRKGRKS